ncbi:MAG: GIY-YIG nuclease family protein [Candidatus Aenigmarchaeota archaeon]
MKGSYVLVLHVSKEISLKVGKLGWFTFKPGEYAYVGSAMNGLEARVARHRRRDRKKIFWHIDYLISNPAVVVDDVLLFENKSVECELSLFLKRYWKIPVKGFGSSDCNCETHLYYRGPSSKYPLRRFLAAPS